MRRRGQHRIRTQNGLPHRFPVVAVERPPAGEHLVEDHGQRPDVGAPVHRAPRRLLGAHVRHSPHHRPRIHEWSVMNLRNAEVEHLRRAVGQHDNVGRLDVEVHDAGVVRVLEPARDLQRDRERFVEGKTSASDPLLQRLAVVQRHRDEQLSIAGLADSVNRANVGVIECRRRPGFRDEPRLRPRIGAERRRQELERHVTSEPLVARFVHDAHAAGANCLLDDVFGNRAAGPVDDRFPQQRAGRRHERRQAIDDTLLVVGEQQRFHFASEISVGAAARVHERAALLRGAFDCLTEDILNERPPIRCRGVAMFRRTAHASSSRFSHARAVAHSRLTVAGDTCSASAVSSTVIPP